MDRGVARWAVTVVLLVVGSTAAPATAASTVSPAVQAATASGTPTIPPPEPLTCTPSGSSIFCTKRTETCETIGGVRTCYVKRVTCLQIGKYGACFQTTLTCRTVTSPSTGRPRTTCRSGFGVSIPRTAASVVSGSIPRFTPEPSRGAGKRSAMTLVSTTTAAAPPVATAVASPGSTVPAGTGIGALVLVFAFVGLTISRRRPRSGG
jgi:hypothetical protein